ncbi:conserved membrane hypothetical protein [Arthrobacter sp. 9V]|uniref:hypothetical protein n=1 Tax=Arthrobacter sp. 9V TaxID=2653132 RepID=UPI0012F3B1F4|nr:hypothetical protein [Arthrobacter sp. 9V]VXC63083.1 conserved membrane hypothetical protein [Arthrobacter sp. 9V]
MSNPPYPPSNPGDTNQPETNGSQPSAPQPPAPQYGQQSPAAPQYGQQSPAAPQYGQQSSPYGQPAAPQYGQQSSPYGQPAAPQYGQGNNWPSQQPGPTTIPQMVNIGFWLIVGAGVIWLISLFISMASISDPAMRSMIEDQMAAGGAADVRFEDIQAFVVGTMVVMAIIGAALYAVVALNVRKGRNWARILGTVLAAISIFMLVPLSLATLAALLGIAGIVLLYLPASAPYFRKAQPFGNTYQNPYGR